MDQYVLDRVISSVSKAAWAALNTESKALYLVNATRTLDSLASWIGQKYSRDQRLDWPRFDAVIDGYYVDSTTFPIPVVEATCEMAMWSVNNSGAVAVQQNAAFNAIKVGPISIDFNERVGGTSDKYFPDIVPMILADYGSFTTPDLPGANKIKTVRLTRA